MGQVIFQSCGGGGIPSSDLSSTHEQVLSGQSYVGNDTNDDPAVGTMQNNALMTKNGDNGVAAVGISSSEANVPTRDAKLARFATDAKGVSRLNLSVPRGYYPDHASYVSIPSSQLGNAEASQVLSGVSFSSKNYFGANSNARGSMPNRGAWGTTLNLTNSNSAEVTVPNGYHNGGGKVYARIDLTRQNGITNAYDNTIRKTNDKFLVQIPHGVYHINSNGKGNPEIAIDKLSLYKQIGVAGISGFQVTRSGSRGVYVKFNKGSGTWTGLLVTGKIGSYPNSPGDGQIVKDYRDGGSHYETLSTNGNWYFRAWTFWDTDKGRIYGSYYDAPMFNGGYSCRCDSNCGDCSDCGDCGDRCSCNNAYAHCNSL